MYLFSREARLSGGNGMAGVEWATRVCHTVKEVGGHDLQLWATVYSPAFGSMSWTAWFEDLGQLEALGDKLNADPGYTSVVNEGAAFTEGGLDDSLLRPVHGAPDPEREVTYVSGVRAVLAAGNIERGMTAAVEIAQAAEKATGLTTMVLQSSTGPYGGIGWLTGYPDIDALQHAQEALGEDPDLLNLIDASEGCFVEDAAVTQQTIYRRLA